MDLSEYRYDGDRKIKLKKVKTDSKGEYKSREDAVDEFISNLKEINVLQQKLYAERKEGVVFIFQAMDAAGKDGVIRTVFSTLTPHGVKEYCFKVPSVEEASHDYLWRFWSALPARGHISIFNRSYYEDVLVGKVHKLYENQVRPDRLQGIDVIKQRYKEIKDYERFLYNNGTRVVKIFLNVSKDEQAKRFISRIDTPRKNWKISAGDIKEREYWDEYQDAFEKMINTTSTDYSPWYVVPADHKWFARVLVSNIVIETLKEMNPHYPHLSKEELADIKTYRQTLIDSLEDSDDFRNEGLTSAFVDSSEVSTDIISEEEHKKIEENSIEETISEENEEISQVVNEVSEVSKEGFLTNHTLENIEDVLNNEKIVTEKSIKKSKNKVKKDKKSKNKKK